MAAQLSFPNTHLFLMFKSITGRNFEYDEALEIIQFEEYSEDIDFDEIRRYDIQKKIGELHRKVNLRKGRQNNPADPQEISERCKKKQCKKFKPGFDLEHVENAGENKNKKKKVKTYALFFHRLQNVLCQSKFFVLD